MTKPPPLHVSVIAAVAAGGVAGAVLRYVLTVAFPDSTTGFPWTIFAVNVLGCFTLALLPHLRFVRRHALLPPLLGTGVLGGFTTLSTYAEQSRALVQSGHAGTATAYVVGTLVVCLAAVVLAERFTSAVQRGRFAKGGGDL
ncbi:MAG: CrcB family protein [Nocardioidaceae bacterium]